MLDFRLGGNDDAGSPQALTHLDCPTFGTILKSFNTKKIENYCMSPIKTFTKPSKATIVVVYIN